MGQIGAETTVKRIARSRPAVRILASKRQAAGQLALDRLRPAVQQARRML
jgi:hypothetical protein